jgi:SAM-dependent methyltransferase
MKNDFSLILSQFQDSGYPIVLEFGPGDIKKYENSIGLDFIDKGSVDYLCDLSKGLSFIPDSCIDLIYTSHFLEHIDSLQNLLLEVNRVLKPGGKMVNIVPHFSNPYFYSDYTHKNFWGLYSVLYFSSDKFFKRDVPRYYNQLDFKINKVYLNFTSPFRPVNLVKKFFRKLFNSHLIITELYEENLTWIIPCYEIHFEIEKK